MEENYTLTEFLYINILTTIRGSQNIIIIIVIIITIIIIMFISNATIYMKVGVRDNDETVCALGEG